MSCSPRSVPSSRCSASSSCIGGRASPASNPLPGSGLVEAAPHMPPALLWPAFLLILVGFGTKVGLVPMHTWLPDAHSQAPASICALLSGVETTTVLYVILRLFPVIGVAPGLDARPWFIGFGLLSVGIATLLLIYVRDFKRMFAFSTVEHMGIILVAAGLGGADAHLGAAYQMTGHAIAKSFCFFAAGMTVMAVGTQDIASVRGLIRSSPLAAIALLAGGFAIAGAPPFAIFVSEFVILKAGLTSGQYLRGRAFGLLCRHRLLRRHVPRQPHGVRRHLTERAALAVPRSCKAHARSRRDSFGRYRHLRPCAAAGPAQGGGERRWEARRGRNGNARSNRRYASRARRAFRALSQHRGKDEVVATLPKPHGLPPRMRSR